MSAKKRIRLARRQQGKLYITVDGIKLIEEAAAGGLKRSAIAAQLGIGASTFNDILKRDEKAQTAFEQGSAANEHELVDLLMAEARSNGAKANTARIFLLKTRHGYREIGPTNNDAGPVVNITLPPPMSAEELQRFLDHRKAIPHDDQD